MAKKVVPQHLRDAAKKRDIDESTLSKYDEDELNHLEKGTLQNDDEDNIHTESEEDDEEG